MYSKRAWVASAVIGLLLSTLGVVQASGAKFTASTASAGNAATADQVSAASGLTATASAIACRITLSWTATSSSWAGGHHVYRAGDSAGPYSLIASVTPRTTTTYADESASLKVGITYHYQVRATYGTWVSPASNTASASGPASCLGG